MIKARHKVREAFAACSSGEYYHTKGYGIGAFDDRLRVYGWCLSYGDTCGMHGDDGRMSVGILERGERIGNALLTWHRMPSGRYEMIGYIQ